MHYQSTRGRDTGLSFSDVLLAGLAHDGGLYVPEKWPHFSAEKIAAFAGKPYAEIATEVIFPFVEGDLLKDELRAMCDQAYANFAHPAIAPLTQLDSEQWVMELFHGPTLAFKDVAMQLLGLLFQHFLKAQGKRLTIVGATSGDTGGAAIEALKGLTNVDVFILHPEGRISEVQRRIMTCVDASNIHNIAVKGSFDDCQRLVKEMFADQSFKDKINLGAINSINWARIIAQVCYYFTSAVALGAPQRGVSYVVPTGNFGDIFAGYVAKKMGLPIADLCVATNSNDILTRVLTTGLYKPDSVNPTISPSMDIQVSSNFERLIYEQSGRDGTYTQGLMDGLKKEGVFQLSDDVLTSMQQIFSAYSVTETETQEMMLGTLEKAHYVVDPHTAVGLVAAQKAMAQGKLCAPIVTLATAHAAKFPDATEAATHQRPALPLRFADLYDRKERFAPMPDDLELIKAHILSHR